MPVASPNLALGMRQGGGGDQVPMRAVRLPAMVLPPRHFVRVGLEAMAADPVMNPELGTAEPAEIRLGPIGRSAVLALVLDEWLTRIIG